jgi:hypothetical protein
MGFTKTQSVESAQVLSPEEHQRIESNLHRIGKTSAKSLSDEDRAKVLRPE